MFLNQELLQSCEDFFDQIANINDDENLDDAILALRLFLERDVDGFTQNSDEKLSRTVQSKLESIWQMICREEKSENLDLVDLYTELLTITEDASDYESDGADDEFQEDHE